MNEIDLGLDNDDYWSNPTRTMDDVMDRLESEAGLVLGAPTAVDTAQRSDLPAIIYRSGKDSDLALRSFRSYALIAAMHLDTKTLYLGYAAPQDFDPKPPRSDADELEGWTVAAHKAEIREQLNLPWQPGQYRFTAILGDELSNTAVSNFGKGRPDPDVDALIAAEAEKIDPPAVFPATSKMNDCPSYERVDGSPPIPDSPGISINLERAVALREDAACILYGSYRLPLSVRDRVKLGSEEYNREAGFVSDDGPTPVGVVPISLVVTGADEPAACLLHLFVPTFDTPSGDSDEVTGYFSVDLLRLPDMPKDPQGYFVYAFSGESICGPAKTALVEKERLH